MKELLQKLYDNKIDLSLLLLEAKNFTSIIDDPEFTEFVEKEINGYKIEDGLPKYREINGQLVVDIKFIYGEETHKEYPIDFSLLSEKVGLDYGDSTTFESFVNTKFKFFLKAYRIILDAQKTLTEGLEHVFYIHRWGIAPTLSIPLMLAPLNLSDDDAIVKQKIDLVARYIETFSVRRSLNFKLFSATSIRYTMYSLVKEIRQKDLGLVEN